MIVESANEYQAASIAAALEPAVVRANPRRGRLKASISANPFAIGKDGTREEVMSKYRAYLMGNPELLEKLPELKGKVLGCWCAPEECHGDILSEFANGSLS